MYRAAKRLAAALCGQQLTRGELRHPRLAGYDLSGRAIVRVHSVGKHLFIRFDDDRSLHTHFLMDGAWHLYRPGQRWRRPAHQARAVLASDDYVAVGFCLHEMALLATANEHQMVHHLGPDLLKPGWGEQDVSQVVQRLRSQPDTELGLALLDQRVMAGIGNVYKAEICFLLGVSPWIAVREVNPQTVVQVARRLLLANVTRPTRSTTGQLAHGRRYWVYERAGQPCHRCATLVLHAGQGGGVQARFSYYCPRALVANMAQLLTRSLGERFTRPPPRELSTQWCGSLLPVRPGYQARSAQ